MQNNKLTEMNDKKLNKYRHQKKIESSADAITFRELKSNWWCEI